MLGHCRNPQVKKKETILDVKLQMWSRNAFLTKKVDFWLSTEHLSCKENHQMQSKVFHENPENSGKLRVHTSVHVIQVHTKTLKICPKRVLNSFK